jgi:transcription initiation factor TFIIH subunit 2
MHEDNETRVSHAWENISKRSWESVVEDDEGNILMTSIDRERSSRVKLNRITQSVRRGLIRYLLVVLDCSKSSNENDYKPNRLEVMKKCLKSFVADFYDQNPISQLSVAVTKVFLNNII